MQSSFFSRSTKVDSLQLPETSIVKELETSEPSKRVYEFWKGSNRFKFNGKLILGPKEDNLIILSFNFFILLYTACFYLIILPEIQDNEYFWITGISYGVCLAIFYTFYILTSFTEPGYLPHSNLLSVPNTLNISTDNNKKIIRRISGLANYDFNRTNYVEPPNNIAITINAAKDNKAMLVESNIVSVVNSDNRSSFMSNYTGYRKQFRSESISPVNVCQNSDIKDSKNLETLKTQPDISPQQDSEVVINDSAPEIKPDRYCVYCNIYKLERSSHCSKCNSCVRVYDHHCTLANNCIGKRNYWCFLGFVIFGFILSSYFVIAIFIIENQNPQISNIIYYLIWALFGVQCLIIFSFGIFHLSLNFIFRKTTKEFFNDERVTQDSKEDKDSCVPSESLINFEQLLTKEQIDVLTNCN